MSSLVALLLASTFTAHAAPAAPAPACDVKGLLAKLNDATPGATPAAFNELAACDAGEAYAAASTAFKKMPSGPAGEAAALTAVKLAAYEPVRNWVRDQVSDERASTLAKLGNSCEEKNVPAFFTDAARVMGDSFFTERWFAPLSNCRAEPVQALLSGALEKFRRDRGLFGAVISVYARNLGAAAAPGLQAMIEKETDPLVTIDLLKALPDAAGVGSPQGANPRAVEAALAALNAVAPKLAEKPAEGARSVYLALGDELGADKLAGIRYRAAAQPDGTLLYGVVVLEVATCKNGTTKAVAHAATVSDPGRTWPDQLKERVESGAKQAFTLTLGESCKGTSAFTWYTPTAPFADTAAYKKWVDSQLPQVAKDAGGVPPKLLNHPVYKL